MITPTTLHTSKVFQVKHDGCKVVILSAFMGNFTDIFASLIRDFSHACETCNTSPYNTVLLDLFNSEWMKGLVAYNNIIIVPCQWGSENYVRTWNQTSWKRSNFFCKWITKLSFIIFLWWKLDLFQVVWYQILVLHYQFYSAVYTSCAMHSSGIPWNIPWVTCIFLAYTWALN